MGPILYPRPLTLEEKIAENCNNIATQLPVRWGLKYRPSPDAKDGFLYVLSFESKGLAVSYLQGAIATVLTGSKFLKN